MLASIRKFSKSFVAKIFVAIIALPFILWGMGDVFRGGNKNTVATINKEKITTDNFVEYLNSLGLDQNYLEKNLESDLFQKILMNLVNQKLIALESEKLGINISKESLAKIIKNDSNFKIRLLYSNRVKQILDVYEATKKDKFLSKKLTS